MKIALFILLVVVFKFGYSQTISTIAGIPGVAGYSGNGSFASSAKLFYPSSVCKNKDGNIFIADAFNNVIRKITLSGQISTIAGTGVAGYNGDGLPATSTQLIRPGNLAIDGNNNMYFSDGGINSTRIRKINTAGIIYTVAGTGIDGFSGNGGSAINAQINGVTEIVIDNSGNIFFCDFYNHMVRKISVNGIITTIAGNGIFGYSGDNGSAITAQLNFPAGLAIDKNGNIFIGDDENYVIRKVNASGIITTIAGTAIKGYAGDGGSALSAKLSGTTGLCFDNLGNLVFSDHENYVVRKITPQGLIYTIAGTGIRGYAGDGGPAITAKFTAISDVYCDNLGNILIADTENQILRKIDNCIVSVSASAAISSPSFSICEGEILRFTANAVNGGLSPVYQWLVNGRISGSDSYIFNSNSLKDGDVVNCRLISSLDCVAPVNSNNIRITVYPVPAISAGSDKIIMPASNTMLVAKATGSVATIQWTPPIGLNDSKTLNPIASPAKTTIYALKVISNYGCFGTDTVKVTVYRKLIMPNAFTPNGDGKNDVFKIPEGITISLLNFSIYNRWGEIVFTTNDANLGWNGKVKAIPQATGIYVYVISGTDPFGKIAEQGTVLLIR